MPNNKKKTLLLVMPPQAGLLEGFSSGLIALGNYVKLNNEDTEIRVLDFGLTPMSRIFARVQQELHDLSGLIFAGITGTTASYQSMLRTAEAFKNASSDVVTIFGGPHATAQDDVILRRHACVDFVIRGEGEVALSILLTHHRMPAQVPNLSFRDGSLIRRTEDAPPLEPAVLDRLYPYPTFPGELSSQPGKFGRVTYVSARGCPLKCAFCAVSNSTVRAKSVPMIIKDLRHLVQQGHERIAIEDNFFAHQPRRTRELCAEIARLQKEVSFSWDCQTRVESMRCDDIVSAMADANCDAVYLGVESLVPEQLEFLGKTPRPREYLESLRTEVLPKILRAGMGVKINLQLGMPDENGPQRQQTLDELSQLGQVAVQYGSRIEVHPQLHVIYPGTRHFSDNLAKATFGSLSNEVFEEFTRWEADNHPILKYFGEHFAHGNGGLPIGILDSGELLNSRFKIVANSIDNLSSQLKEMEKIDGISVFKYGKYLAEAAEVRRSDAVRFDAAAA